MLPILINDEKIVVGQYGWYVNGVKQTDKNVINEYIKMIFWKKVAIKAENNMCWEWQGAKNEKGYGVTSFNGKTTAASRKAYMLHNNVILYNEKMLVCHTCDNPVCCNPDHLFLGTSADNMKDMSIKGRAKGQYIVGQKRAYENILRGSKNPYSKLEEKDVIEIRRLRNENGMLLKEIGRIFKMSVPSICEIINYKTWNHVN